MRYFLIAIVILTFLSCSDSGTRTAETEHPQEATNKTSPSDTTPSKPETIVATPALDSAFLIVPGQRIGQISLGETAEKITSTLGQPDSGDAAMGKALSFWLGKGRHKQNYVAVYFSRNFDGGPEDLLARQIRVNSPSFKTIENVGIGNNISTIRQHHILQPIAYYLNPQQQRTYIFDDTPAGIAFEITTPDSTCTAITIHQKGENVTNSYLPVYPDLIRLNR
ncbi:hypothetical protein [Pontibacter pudoricolor]|uniref:hypothetical protein n=1 Tax=Pontibacter pudoricolor TaxID=2694930 RepID=UPI001390E002|nr:hypothetical protein [Pontibacter pudoricolor]